MFFKVFTLFLLLAVVVECFPGKKGKKDKKKGIETKRVFYSSFNFRVLPLLHLLLLIHESLLSMMV
jgi:hypothetical protein